MKSSLFADTSGWIPVIILNAVFYRGKAFKEQPMHFRCSALVCLFVLDGLFPVLCTSAVFIGRYLE